MKTSLKKRIVAIAMVSLLAAGSVSVPAILNSTEVHAAVGDTGTYTDNAGNEFGWTQTSAVSIRIDSFNNPKKNSFVEVPATINGIPVRYLQMDSFKDNQDITEVKLNEGILTIDKGVFRNCLNLKKINIPNTVTSLYFPSTTSVKNLTVPNKLCEEFYTVKDAIYTVGVLNNEYSSDNPVVNLEVDRNELKNMEEYKKEAPVGYGTCFDYLEEYAKDNGVTLNYLGRGNTSITSKPTQSTTTTPSTSTPSKHTTTTPSTSTLTSNNFKGSIMLDTANYKLDKNNQYTIGVTIKDQNGNKLSAEQVKNLVTSGKLKVSDSRTGSIFKLEQLSNGNFRVTGKNLGTAYVVYEIGGTHASVRIDVQSGVKQHGTAVRNTSIFTKDVF